MLVVIQGAPMKTVGSNHSVSIPRSGARPGTWSGVPFPKTIQIATIAIAGAERDPPQG